MKDSASIDLRQLFQLAVPAGTFLWAIAAFVVVAGWLGTGRSLIPWSWLALAYPLAVVFFVVVPVLIWAFFRVFALVRPKQLGLSISAENELK